MAGYDIGVGVPTGPPEGEVAEPLSPGVVGDPPVPGADSLSSTEAPERATGGDYDLGLSTLVGSSNGSFVEPLAPGVLGAEPLEDLVQSPGDPPPPETGIPFEATNQVFTGSASEEVTSYADRLCLMQPSGALVPVVTVVAAGDYKPTAPTFDVPFDMFGATPTGEAGGEFPEPSLISEKSAPDPETSPAPGPAYPPVPDNLAPATPVFGTIEGSQVNGDPLGRTQVVLNWTIPTTSQEVSGEFLDDATGAAQSLLVEYSPVTAASYDIFEVTGFTVGGGDTTLASASSLNEFKITVTDPANFTVNSWVEVEEGAQKEYAQILAINGSVLTLYNPLTEGDYTGLATVKNVDVVQKTETTDYTINLTSGAVDLVAGQFTASNPVFARYRQNISDMAGFEVHRLEGQEPFADGAHIDDVLGHVTLVTVDDALAAGATTASEVLDSTDNGETWTYYLFAKDENGNLSRGQAVYVETLISKVQNLQAAVASGSITLSWDAITDPNFNGVNIFRSPGGTFDPSQATKVNSLLVTGTSFEDGSGNVVNRRTPGEISYPQGGLTYSYSVEAEDSATDWDTGTQNQSLDPSKAAIGTATKTDD